MDFDKKLDKLMAVKTDRSFLTLLSKWLFKLTGNVNATVRLQEIARRTKGSQGEGL